ncbi:DUF3164 family protein [Ferruginibacter yonginensis]|uniref:DUF3164 family protein n=1 Tax=Ferruginibacter yonginensis TaxID=1310416 RepID=A0ABV8QTU3_9BACT
MKKVKFHNSKDAIWCNADGDNVPVKFVPKADKQKEVLAAKVYKAALATEGAIASAFKTLNDAFAEVDKLIKEEFELKEKKRKPSKGNFTWFNFDRSLKIEREVNEIVKFDNALMSEALEQLKTYINNSIGSDSNALINGLVTKAFANTKGMIDPGKVFQILSYQDKIKNQNFQKACEIIKKAQSIDRTKQYIRVFEKTETGEYRHINLNFSSL